MENLKQAVTQVVSQIYEQKGAVRASELLQEASDPLSPAHPAFEWDDTKAGHEHRLWQARQWIRRITVMVEKREERMIHVPVVKVSGTGALKETEGYYKPISNLKTDVDEYEIALESTKNRLIAAQKSYEELKSVAPDEGIKIDFERADVGFTMINEALVA